MPADTRDRYTSPGQAGARFVAQRWLLKPLVWSLVSVTVVGRKALKSLDGAFVVVANHSSHLDAPLIFGALPRRLSRYLAAGAAADYFFDVWWRRGLTALFFNGFPVDRSGVNPRSVSAKELLKRGVPLLVFPEGTRSKDGTFGNFKPGAAALAASVGVPCLPVALIGANTAHPRGSNWPKPGRLPVGVVFGAPMLAEDGESAADFMGRVRAEIARLRDEHSDRILKQTPEGDAA
ncbi:lysophospholipid acyltransferase family protein [Lysinimonas soli]|uniref:Lysophospholipid acyltransferase family protein n=1 Tax=Lysinimonas soli TaxID=1074233 RepID=A0ABW0NRF4_9MICO